MASVKDYYPGDFWSDVKQSLDWLHSRQTAPVGGWRGSAAGTPPRQATQFAQCGLVSIPDFSTFAQAAVENIVIDPPAGVTPDLAAGPDGFPINFSPQGLPSGNILLNPVQNPGPTGVSGRGSSLLQP